MSGAAVGFGPDMNTSVGETVIIQVPSDGPYGVVFEADKNGSAAVIKGWERLFGGRFGPIQKHGGVHIGDVLFAINDTQLDYVPHAEVMVIVNDRNILKKVFKFMSSAEYYRRKNASSATSSSGLGHESRSQFLSLIRRAKLNQDLGPTKKYVEYEIACQLRSSGIRVEKEIIYKWSVWKRYSDFEQLHKALKRSLGWLMSKVELPPAHTFVFDKFSAEFIEQRRDELNTYLQGVLGIEKIAEFHKHHCSHELRDFLDVEATVRNAKASSPSGTLDDEFSFGVLGLAGASSSSSARLRAGVGPLRRAPADARRPLQSLAMRRRLPKQQGPDNDVHLSGGGGDANGGGAEKQPNGWPENGEVSAAGGGKRHAEAGAESGQAQTPIVREESRTPAPMLGLADMLARRMATAAGAHPPPSAFRSTEGMIEGAPANVFSSSAASATAMAEPKMLPSRIPPPPLNPVLRPAATQALATAPSPKPTVPTGPSRPAMASLLGAIKALKKDVD